MATPTEDPERQERDEAAAIRERMSRKLGGAWWSFMARGAVAAVLGLTVLIWPSASLAFLLALVGLFCLIDGIANLLAVFGGGERDMHLIQAVFGLALGGVFLFWPGISVRGLLIMFGAWVLLTGVSQIVAARRIDLDSDERGAMTAVGALAAFAGLVLLLWPGSGAVFIGWLVAIATLAVAGLLIFVALRLKRLKERLDERAAAGG